MLDCAPEIALLRTSVLFKRIDNSIGTVRILTIRIGSSVILGGTAQQFLVVVCRSFVLTTTVVYKTRRSPRNRGRVYQNQPIERTGHPRLTRARVCQPVSSHTPHLSSTSSI